VDLVRSGAGTALVGSRSEAADRIADYAEIGIDEFIFSGCPHFEECSGSARACSRYCASVGLFDSGRIDGRPARPSRSSERRASSVGGKGDRAMPSISADAQSRSAFAPQRCLGIGEKICLFTRSGGSPDPVHLRCGQCVFAASAQHRAVAVDLNGPLLSGA